MNCFTLNQEMSCTSISMYQKKGFKILLDKCTTEVKKVGFIPLFLLEEKIVVQPQKRKKKEKNYDGSYFLEEGKNIENLP